jgi:uncharacterized protein (TIGR03435 family)
MFRAFDVIALALSIAELLGQTSVIAPEFAAASIKPDIVGTNEGVGKGREVIETNPGSLKMPNIRLSSALSWAYRIQPNQISGPDGIYSERYLILARTDGAVSEGELRVMLRKLLIDRFRMSVHWETKETPAFVIVLNGRGSKLKPSPDEGEGGVRYGQGNSVIAEKATLAQFADSLVNPLRTVVLDETSLKGHYDFTLDLNVYEPGHIAPEDMPTLLDRAMKEQLGLKLESRKSKIPMLIVDHAERVPKEN